MPSADELTFIYKDNFPTFLHAFIYKATRQNELAFARCFFLALASRSLSVLSILLDIYGLICRTIRCRHFIVSGSCVTRSVSVEMASENDSLPGRQGAPQLGRLVGDSQRADLLSTPRPAAAVHLTATHLGQLHSLSLPLSPSNFGR